MEFMTQRYDPTAVPGGEPGRDFPGDCAGRDGIWRDGAGFGWRLGPDRRGFSGTAAGLRPDRGVAGAGQGRDRDGDSAGLGPGWQAGLGMWDLRYAAKSMAWLVRDTKVLASVEVADTFAGRCRGLLGRDGIDGALLLRPARSVHTLGMRFAIDVAHCDGDLRVLHITRMRPHRIGRPFRRAYVIIEAEAGVFERWGLHVGDELALHGEEAGPTGPDPGVRRRHALRRRLSGWRSSHSPVASAVPVGAGPGGRDGAPLVGIPGRSRLATPSPGAAGTLAPLPAMGAPMTVLSESVAGMTSDSASGPASAAGSEPSVLPSPSTRPSRSPGRRSSPRRPIPVACW